MPDISGGHIDKSGAGWALQEGTPKKNLAAPALAKNSRHDPAVGRRLPNAVAEQQFCPVWAILFFLALSCPKRRQLILSNL